MNQKDFEVIENLIYKNGDDLAVSMARGLERLEERVDRVESRLYSRISDLEDMIAKMQVGIDALVEKSEEELLIEE